MVAVSNLAADDEDTSAVGGAEERGSPSAPVFHVSLSLGLEWTREIADRGRSKIRLPRSFSLSLWREWTREIADQEDPRSDFHGFSISLVGVNS